MNKNTILLLGAGLFSGMILWTRANTTDLIIAGTVQDIEIRDETAGPESFHIIAQTDLGVVELAPRAERPQLSPGDPVCITVTRAMGREDTFARAPQSAEC